MASEVTVQACTTAHVDAAIGVRRIVYPYLIASPDRFRRSFLEAPPRRRAAAWVARVDDNTIVGLASCALDTWTSEQGRAGASVQVVPDRRREGIGTALFEAMLAHAAAAGARRMQVFAQQESAGFAVRLGFEPNRELRYVSADLASLPEQPATPPDLALLPFAALEPRGVFEADREASVDEPSDSPADAFDYDEWFRDTWEDPVIDLGLSVAAVATDGRVASYTIVETDGERAWSAMSGTVRAQRGRGLAKLVKSAALRRCADAGITVAATSMDERNGPMLAVNAWLGYRQVATHIGLSRAV